MSQKWSPAASESTNYKENTCTDAFPKTCHKTQFQSRHRELNQEKSFISNRGLALAKWGCAPDQIANEACHMQLLRFWMSQFLGRSLNRIRFEWTNCAAHGLNVIAWLIVLAMLQNANIIRHYSKRISYLVQSACINCCIYYVRMYFVVRSFVLHAEKKKKLSGLSPFFILPRKLN